MKYYKLAFKMRMGPRGPGGFAQRPQEAPNTQKVFLGCLEVVQGPPWGDVGRLEWSAGPIWEAEMFIFCLF